MKYGLVFLGLLLAVYCGADLVEKGEALNALTPWPILGWVLWAMVVWAVWYWLVWPVCGFLMLRSAADVSPVQCGKAALRYLRRQKQRSDAESAALVDLESALNRSDMEDLQVALEAFDAVDTRKHEAKRLISKYCNSAALGVVFSRNKLVDGVLLLVIQCRLVVALARLAGYKPSPVFNALCFGWVLSNSLMAALLTQDAAELASDALMEALTGTLFSKEELAADCMGSKWCNFTVSALLEATMGGSAVYVTGHLFMSRLQLGSGEKKPPRGFKDLIELKRQGIRYMGQNLLTGSMKALEHSMRKQVARMFSSVQVPDEPAEEPLKESES